MIELIHLIKPYGPSRAINDLNLSVAAGECLALWGHNGAGKSTTLKCILGLVNYQGTITVAGQDARRASRAVRRLIGYVPQELAYWDMSVGATVEFLADLKQVPPAQALAVLERVGLAAEMRKAVGALSGGMRQRLALALALLAEPPVLLLDEPTASLDERSRAGFMDLLLECKQAGKTILFASHRPEEVLRLADRVAVLDAGGLVGVYTPSEFALRLAPDRAKPLAGGGGLA